ncbi:MAG: hypothetical protein Q7S38_00670 [bacterium]|nr:hypothetical protein [bacterium]
MKLPFSFNFNKKEEPEYLLALLLKDEKANAIMVEKLAGVIRVISTHEEYFNDSIETATQEELLEVLDKTISTAEEKLPPQIEVKKTIFGVKEEWATDAGIKKEYLEKLKFVSQSLDLSPIGFLVIIEAITHALQKEEGAPVSAILVEPGKKHIGVSLLRAGRIIETRHAPIEGSIVKTTDAILHNFTQYEILPSRIIISYNKSGDELHQEFIAHSWSKSLPFLHVPQIMILPEDFEAKAVLVGAATQMGLEFLKEKTPIEEPEHTVQKHKQKLSEPIENFGFITEKDIARKEDLPAGPLRREASRQESHIKVVDNREAETPLKKQTTHFSSLIMGGANTLAKVFSFLFAKLRFFNLSLPKGGKIIFIPPIIIIFIILFIALYIFILKATITLTISPKVIEKNQAITIATTTPTDLSKNIIQGQFLEVSQEGIATVDTTGTKEVGDKSKGEVTFYSRFTEEKTLPKGTVLTSSNNLEFILDDNISFASSSADASSPPSTKKASVTAKIIGKESNLPSGAKFTVGVLEQSVVIAKNDTAFSGGSKKEVVVVSKDDLAKLKTQLPKDLEKKAKETLDKELSQNSAILPVFIKTTLTKTEFDKKEGEETKDVTLKGTVAYQTVSYKKSDFEEFTNDLLKRDLRDMTFDKNKIAYELKNAKLKDKNNLSATIFIKAFLIPNIDNQQLKDSISGKSFDNTREILGKLPQVSGVDILLTPNLPFLPALLPRLSQNITLILETNE